MSQSVLRAEAVRLGRELQRLAGLGTAPARGFLNFNPIFYSCTDESIDAGVLLQGESISRDLREYHKKALQEYNLAIESARNDKSKLKAQLELEKKLETLGSLGVYGTGEGDNRRSISEVEIKQLIKADGGTTPDKFNIEELTDDVKILFRRIYRQKLLEGLKGRTATLSEFTAAKAKLARDLQKNGHKFLNTFNDSVLEAEELAFVQAYQVAASKKTKDRTASDIEIYGRDDDGSKERQLASFRALSTRAGLQKNTISQEFLKALKFPSTAGTEEVVLIGILEGTTLVGILGISPFAFGREDTTNGFRQIRTLLTAALAAVGDELKKLENTAEGKILQKLNFIKTQIQKDKEVSVSNVDIGHIGTSGALGQAMLSIKSQVEETLHRLGASGIGNDDAAYSVVAGLNSLVHEIEEAHRAFSDTLYSVTLSKGVAADTEEGLLEAALGIVYTLGQNSTYNQTLLGSGVEAKLKAKFAELAGKFAELEGSKSLKTIVEESLVNVLLGKRYKYRHATKPGTSRGSIKDKNKPKGKVQVMPSVKGGGKSSKLPTVPKISVKSKTRESLLNLSNLLMYVNMNLPPQVKENMGPPRLQYRTGRFANSTRVVTISPSTNGSLVFNYTYMKYPYQVFEKNKNRDPRPLIAKSIRDIVTPVVAARFRSVRV